MKGNVVFTLTLTSRKCNNMKKLDLHLHTLSSNCDKQFEFDINRLKEYVIKREIDGIAITNHNLFDRNQYEQITRELGATCKVFPGIEINLGDKSAGHMLCIAESTDMPTFAEKCSQISEKIKIAQDYISFTDLKEIFVNLDRYLWIPHYGKKPSIDKTIITQMGTEILCGEVASIKKFIYCSKDANSLTPVYFSDFRLSACIDDSENYPVRQTFFDISEVSLRAIKICLSDKSKVTLNATDGNAIFEVIPELPISTGLNVMLGGRSSGKTFTLDEIARQNGNVKYIKQFALIEPNPEKAAKKFTEDIANKRKTTEESYFKEFAKVVDDIKDVSVVSDETMVGDFIESLVKNANEADMADAFSKCQLFSESEFPDDNLEGLKNMISSVQTLLEEHEYRTIVDKYIERTTLVNLFRELVGVYSQRKETKLKKQWINGVVAEIKRLLQLKTSSTPIDDVDLYKVAINKIKVEKFNKLVAEIKKQSVINSIDIGGFTVQTKKRPFSSASELKSISGKRDVRFSEIMDTYKTNPYIFLMHLKTVESIQENEYYKYFAYVEYEILNQYNAPVSGGERAEFNLLQQIKDANQYEMLLIDEPESSFDNIFLKQSVNEIIKDIASRMPVIIVTHNNTVGESIKPDYLIHTCRIIEEQRPVYKRYYGRPSDKFLHSFDGDSIKNIDVVLDYLEAGEKAYLDRSHDYEMLKD